MTNRGGASIERHEGKESMRRALSLIALLPVMLTACSLNHRPTLSPTKMAEFWQEPADLAQRDLLHGPGGAALAPDPNESYVLLGVDTTGFSRGYDVRDGTGRKWSVKLGPESRTEVVVSRIVWAMGYHQPYVYYLPRWTLNEDGKQRTEGSARFRLSSTQKNLGVWSWRNNPFLDTRPFAGLFVLMTIVNNWDVKSEQNAVYRFEREGQAPRERYVIKDLGASLGRTSWLVPGTRDDIEGFEKEPFIKSVSGNRVHFHFHGAWREPQLPGSITPDDVRWMCERLARLTPDQWRDGFRAGGYTDAEAGRFIRRMQQKVAEGLQLDRSFPPVARTIGGPAGTINAAR